MHLAGQLISLELLSSGLVFEWFVQEGILDCFVDKAVVGSAKSTRGELSIVLEVLEHVLALDRCILPH
jgi:hypothetical protein